MRYSYCYVWLYGVIQIRSQLTKNDRTKFNTVLIIDVHARDIIDSFVRDRSRLLLSGVIRVGDTRGAN